MFSMLRNIPQAYESMRAGKWDRETYKGYEAEGKTIGVIGLGNIGRMVARKAHGLGMKVIGYDPIIKQHPDLGFAEILPDVDSVLARANLVTLHVPKSKETANLINSDRLAKMKKGSFLVNCARGGVVDENAVVNALETQQLAGAAFDVFEKEPPNFDAPIFKHPKVVFVPHLGASTVEAQERVGLTAASQIIGFFSRAERTGIIN